MRKRKKAKNNKTKLPSHLVFIFLGIIFFLTISFFVFPKFQIFKNNNFCANSISCIKDLTGKYQNETQAVFLGKKLSIPNTIADNSSPKTVLGQSTGGNKHIYVDLTNQRLYAFEGGNLVYNFLISSGKWWPTPTGDFNIWIKLRYTKMEGGNQAMGTYYYLPNVPYVMFFYNNAVPKAQGFSLHGTYWHNNFGHPMSHGCVNMKTEEAGLIYAWSDPPVSGNITYATKDSPGTQITIYGVTPKE